MHQSIFEFLDAKRNPALQYIDAARGKSYTWGEVTSLNLPLTGKKLCFLYLDNSVVSVSLLLSALRTKQCICLLSADLKPELKEGLEKNYKPALIADQQRTVITGYQRKEIIAPTGESMNIFENADIQYSIHPDLSVLLPTSGTTGSPKFVKLTDENVISNLVSVTQYLPIDKSDSTPLNLPVYYSYGFSVLLTNTLAGGKIICTNESILSRKFWNQFAEFGCTNFSGVPFTYEMLTRIGFEKMQGFKLRYFTQAGGKLDVKFRKIFAEYALKHEARFFVMYGQTEAAPRMSYLDPAFALAKIDSIGKPVPGGSFSIDPETGELIYKGKNVFKGYSYTPADLNKLEDIPELRTGDLARVDEDGFYYITGRLNRFVKLFGNRVGLDEAEQQLRKKFEGTIGCAGINDNFILVFSNNNALNGDEVRNYISGLYGIHITAVKYKYMADIPLNSNQKIDYPKILAQHGG